jgi:CRISPR-associated endonuclease/helicase Cas3
LALCVASHHSGLIDCLAPDGCENLSNRMDKADSASHLSEAWATADTAVVAAKQALLRDPDLSAPLSTRIQSICRTDTGETIRRFKIGLLCRLLFSCLIDADRTDTADSAKPATAGFRQHGQYVAWPILADRLERALAQMDSGSEMNLLRRRVGDTCLAAHDRPTGAYTLTVPTGGGKTLASLRFALNHAAKWGMHRVIYVSPYTSILDQNAGAARQILEPDGTRSERSSSNITRT